MNKTHFGTLPTGEEIYKFTLTSEDSTAEIISRGATILSFRPFGEEIIAGFDTLEDYLAARSFHGATVGRVCNRIVGASFVMDGKEIKLSKNNGEHFLHGGTDGWTARAWSVLDYGKDFVKLGLSSRDGESGFPADVDVEALFTLKGSALIVSYKAIPYGKTPIMITTHGFFNLNGFATTVDEHEVTIYADQYTEVDEKRLPTGRRASVDGTFLDFRTPHRICERIDESPIGYDHNYILRGDNIVSMDGAPLALAARVVGEHLKLTAYTNQVGIQFYVQMRASDSAPTLHGGIKQFPRCAFCIEPQLEPDCVRRGLAIYDKGEVYESTIVYHVERI